MNAKQRRKAKRAPKKAEFRKKNYEARLRTDRKLQEKLANASTAAKTA